MKTLVAIAHGPNKGDLGWINGELARLNSMGMVIVTFPKRAYPRDMQRIKTARLREATAGEALLCGVSVPSIEATTARAPTKGK